MSLQDYIDESSGLNGNLNSQPASADTNYQNAQGYQPQGYQGYQLSSACPNCGYCAHCGRSTHHFSLPYQYPYSQPIWMSSSGNLNSGGTQGSPGNEQYTAYNYNR